jgi:hypothetical protein
MKAEVTSRFPVCSQFVPSLEARTRRQSAAVPSVPLSFVRLLCTNGGPRGDSYRTAARNRGTVGTRNRVKGLQMEHTGNRTWNN